MNYSFSDDTRVALLLCAPLLAGGDGSSAEPLTPREFRQLLRNLDDSHRQPSDLLGLEASDLAKQCGPMSDGPRFAQLLGREELLGKACERWEANGIWVAGRNDHDYPKRLKTRLGDKCPALLYGCGDAALLDQGGLAVVGSRHVDEVLVGYTERIGGLAAAVQCTVVSGGARGIDQAAMRGALDACGKVCGILADSLERAAVAPDHRDALTAGRLALLSPYDPLAGFNVGNAMQRNKLIYALADAALVVSSDYDKGGTWAGAIEQLTKLRFVPVYVRSQGETGPGLDALLKRGALLWPNPDTPEALAELLRSAHLESLEAPEQSELLFGSNETLGPSEVAGPSRVGEESPSFPSSGSKTESAAEGDLFRKG